MTIDVHSHLYFPRYIGMLRGRDHLPRVISHGGVDRLVILPEEESAGVGGGRPIDLDYWDLDLKLKWMDEHGIAISVVSLANPWLEFMEPDEATPLARRLNNDLEEMCSAHPKRLYGLGVLALQDVAGSQRELVRITDSTWLRGVMIGTQGAGKGLDDPVLDPVWREAERLGLAVYIHPHYGIGLDSFGNHTYALNFALGFPFETSIAAARLILSGALDRFKTLKVVLAHAGGTLPYLSGRLDGCAKSYSSTLGRSPSEQLRAIYYDVTAFHRPAVKCALDFAGANHLMFGTDHPFRRDPVSISDSIANLRSKDQTQIREGTARALFNL